MKPDRETEIKLPVPGRRPVVKCLAPLGLAVVEARHLERNCVFDFPDLRLSKSRHLLRLRRAAGVYLLTLKGPPRRARRYASRAEFETRVENGPLLCQIFAKLGLEPVFRYEKYRTLFAARSQARDHRRPQVAYDETPIGDFLELEGPEKWIDRIAARLGYAPRHYITSTYLALYLRKCLEQGKKPANMLFRRRRSSS